jgi:hypothetical protein
LIRRKINYQQPEYVMNNELICFGLSSQETTEFQPQYTAKAEKDIAIVILTKYIDVDRQGAGSEEIDFRMLLPDQSTRVTSTGLTTPQELNSDASWDWL